jgi:hypothetical protein
VTHRLWDERTGRVTTMRTRCQRVVAVGAGGQFLRACGPETFDLLDAPSRRVRRLPRIPGANASDVATARWWTTATS